ncbi:MAG: phosphatase PAP2 family protein [Bdellovibrionota bacterium]|nr:phosphatase PAP2 family protein [Bdellovibrionota bacterium]
MVKKIVNLWKDYKEDMGLGAMGLAIIFFNTLLFILSGLIFGPFNFYCLIPVFIYLIFFYFRNLIKPQKKAIKFLYSIIPLSLAIGLNYLLVGHIDRSVGGFPRVDRVFVDFDNWLFGLQGAQFIWKYTSSWNEVMRLFFYDYMVLSYMSYYIMPFYFGVLYYVNLDDNEKYKIISYFSTINLYYGVNFLFYLFIPVTGPQYYLEEIFRDPLPLSIVGNFFYEAVHSAQYTKIDCFPSGHTGIAVLVCLWSFYTKHPHFNWCLFLTISIMLATIGLRYHYTLDLLAAFPVAILSFYLGIRIFPEKIVVLSQKSNK